MNELSEIMQTPSPLFDRFVETLGSGTLSDRRRLAYRTIAMPMSANRGRTLPAVEQDMIVFLGRGATKLVAQGRSEQEQIIGFQFPGDILLVPSNEDHHFQLVALDDSELIAFPAEAFLDLARDDPDLLRALFQSANDALHRCRQGLLMVGRRSAQERVAGFLAAMANRIGERSGESCTIDLPMSRREIGESLGLTIETISRQFGELRSDGLLRTSGRSRLMLPDLGAVFTRAGMLPTTP